MRGSDEKEKKNDSFEAKSVKWVDVDKRFILYYPTKYVCVCMRECPSAVAFVRKSIMIRWKINFRKIWTRTRLTCIIVHSELTAYGIVISKVRSTWKYVEFNCVFPLLWRWVRQPQLCNVISLLPMVCALSLKRNFSGSPFLTYSIIEATNSHASVSRCGKAS